VTRLKPAKIRFYFDADTLGLAHTIVQLRRDVTYPGDPGGTIFKHIRPPCEITPETRDSVWIPLVSSKGWLIVTRDRRIQDHTAEINAVRQHGARMVVLSGAESAGTFAQLEILMCRWRDIERCLDQPGPFIYTATRTSFKAVQLTSTESVT